jgi:hypothetical protein
VSVHVPMPLLTINNNVRCAPDSRVQLLLMADVNCRHSKPEKSRCDRNHKAKIVPNKWLGTTLFCTRVSGTSGPMVDSFLVGVGDVLF